MVHEGVALHCGAKGYGIHVFTDEHATDEKLLSCHELVAPLTKAIWLRARDARPWIGEYRAFMVKVRQGKRRQRFALQRDFVAERLHELAEHALISPAASHQAA